MPAGANTLDLVVVIETSRHGHGVVSVMRGNPDGTFQTPKVVYSADEPQSVAVGDFDGDGILDLAVANSSFNVPRPGSVVALLGNGDLTFHEGPTYTAGVGRGLRSVAAGDFNADGKLDFVVTDFSSNNVQVFLGNGDGTFEPPANFAVGNSPYFVAVEDFNGDALPDLVVVNFFPANLLVLINNTP